MITFTRAPTVAPGDPVTSTQFRKLAAAFNARLRSGFADGPWRIVYYWLSLFRQVRNSDEGGLLFPALAEFFTSGYQMLEPDGGSWPVAGPGEPEGSNLANQMMAYVFGAEALELDSEDLRLTEPGAGGIPLWYEGSYPSTPLECWELAKQQRGGWDPDTGAIGSPAFTAARSHYVIRMSERSPHGNAYGGYLPTPDLQPEPCEDPDTEDEIPAPLNYKIRFTALTDGLDDIEYDGTCQPIPSGEPYATHVAGISYTPLAYYVWKNDGSVDILPTADYLEGPYTGESQVRKTANGALNRCLNTFAREFRGSDSQRSALNYHLQEAFDTQAFLSYQYLLAPQRGTESEGFVTAVYPLFRFTGSATIAAGTLATHTQSSTTEHAYHAACVLTACLVTATKLQEACTIEILDDDEVIQTALVDPDEEGNASLLVMINAPTAPSPTLKIRLTTEAQFEDGTGKIEVECTEIQERKPTIEDLFMVLRCGGAITNEVMDGRGIDEASARLISEAYWTHGCIASIHGADVLPGQTDAVNSNAVFDAARRLSQCVRLVPRQQFLGYAVEGGKSVCWFKRRAQIGDSVDMFAGIGPSRLQISSGALMPERKYVVRSGSIIYQEVEYEEGEVFTAVFGVKTFTGTGEVYEYDGIRPTAEPGGLSNEWLMGVQLKAYHPSESSLWKPDAYSDYFPLVNRCHFYSPEIAGDPRLVWHTAFGQRVTVPAGVLTPESPSGWNYAKLTFAWGGHGNVNQIDCDEEDEECQEWRRNFYRSCRIYEPDPEIESATVVIEGEIEVVKLTFKGRFHHAASAPSSIDRDVSTWNVTALRDEAETVRTVENALREYLINQYDATNATATGPGNNAANSAVQTIPDNPYGSVYPHFYFVKLVPSPREDGNDDQNPTDTPIRHDEFTLMELYLRAMCEGYVDGQTSADYACEHLTSTLFDFTFQNLCLQAFGNRWFTLLPLAQRPDNPEGFGPLPNTELYATIFNQFSSAVNLLDRARIMLPMLLEVAFDTGSSTTYVGPTNADGSPASTCSEDQVCAVYWDGTAPDAPITSPDTWHQGVPIQSIVSAHLDGTCSGTAWGLTTSRTNCRVRWRTTDPDAMLALPETIEDMLDEHSAVLARVSTSTSTVSRQLTTLEDSEHCCFIFQEPCPGWWDAGGGQYWKFPVDTDVEETCGVIKGSYVAAPLGPSTFARGMTPSGAECTPGPVNTVGAAPIEVDAAMIQVDLV